MKVLFAVLSIFACHFSAWSEESMLVFINPIEAGKTSLLRDSTLLNSTEEKQLIKDVGLTKYMRWIQTIRGQDFLVQLAQGEDPKRSFEKLSDKIAQNNLTAVKLQQLYLATISTNLSQKDFIPQEHALTKLVTFDKTAEHVKDYAFAYPIIPAKLEEVKAIYQGPEAYPTAKDKEVAHQRGITKLQVWIQGDSEKPYLTVYQEIAGPVKQAREKYLSQLDEDYTKKQAQKFADVSGLSLQELLPQLESLQDKEIVK